MGIYITAGIDGKIKESAEFATAVKKSLRRFFSHDWGEMDAYDKKLNDNALKNGNARIFASYETKEGKIWIITEADRSATTILLPSEY